MMRPMSIKRSKQVSRGSRRRETEGSPFFFDSTPKAVEPEWNWEDHVAGQAEGSFVPYSLTKTFAKSSFILHPVFGKGLVTNVDGGRIEVLFKDGKKKLGHAAAK
jgi:hypothetical protein